jgi:transcriptional regulator with XRE-family HTH domain
MIIGVHETQPISDQLKQRRLELGMSLAEVARKAGTSSASLSRYENGWTRFETYTLQKLAAALACRLRIEFEPRDPAEAAGTDRAAAVARLQRLFWDHPLSEDDLAAHPVWITERVLDFGGLEDVRALARVMGREGFLHAAGKATRVSPRTQDFWRQILELEGKPCTTAYSRNAAWNS